MASISTPPNSVSTPRRSLSATSSSSVPRTGPGGNPRTMRNVKGYLRGYDARTGKRLWIFHTIPQRGQFGYDTWLEGSAEYNGNTGVWAQMSADPELGLVYVPVEMPTGDYYGGNRPGDNLFADSLVALDVKTGKRKWHYQTVHHDVWDWDLACAPILFDMTVNGRTVKAIAQPTKHAFLFVFNRETGQPIWPIEERPVPQSDVPKERTSPTQPFPTKPAPFDRQGVTESDLHGSDARAQGRSHRGGQTLQDGPALHATGRELARRSAGDDDAPLRSRRRQLAGRLLRSRQQLPVHPLARERLHERAGAGESGAVRHGLRRRTGARRRRRRRRGPRSGPWRRGGARRWRGGGRAGTVQGLPLIKPPYDQITAYNMNTGDIIWQKTHSSTPDDIRNHPALKGLNLPRLGQPGRTFIGVLTTKNLVIAGEGGVHTNEAGRRVALLRAYDKATGADVGAVEMPNRQTGSPMSYQIDGKQFIVLAVSGNDGAELLAYALPITDSGTFCRSTS